MFVLLTIKMIKERNWARRTFFLFSLCMTSAFFSYENRRAMTLLHILSVHRQMLHENVSFFRSKTSRKVPNYRLPRLSGLISFVISYQNIKVCRSVQKEAQQYAAVRIFPKSFCLSKYIPV